MIDEEVLLRYAGSLIQLWFNSDIEEYPLNAETDRDWIAPLGLPRTSYWATFNSKEELWGRIRMLGQLCNAEVLKASNDTETIEVHL